MKLTPKQNKVVYALRDQGVPAEWAILVAQRANAIGLLQRTDKNFGSFISSAFLWIDSPEGHEFWQDAAAAARDEAAQ